MFSKIECGKHFLAAVAAVGLLGAVAGENLAYADEDKSGERNEESGVIPVDSYFDDMATDSTEPLGIIWVLALDISISIESAKGEYDAQLSAFADAIERDDFREAIFGPGGPGSAGIFVVDFDHQSKLQIGGVDFRENDRERFREFAEKLRNLPRRTKGITGHYAALENASVCFDMANQRGWTSDRKYVNVMTDGSSPVRDYNYYYRSILAQRHEAIVSSLVIRSFEEPYTYERVKEDLTTPPRTFLSHDQESVLEGGFTEEVATELETQGGNISRYQDKTFMIMRNQITTHTAWLDFDDDRGTRFAMVDPVSRRALIIPPELSK